MYQNSLKPEMINEKMDHMLTDLKSKIKVNLKHPKDEVKLEGLQIEIENDHMQDLEDVMHGDQYANDYFLGKREDPYGDNLLGPRMSAPHPHKRLVTPSDPSRPVKLEDSSQMLQERPLASADSIPAELQTPRPAPALNITLIDKTYTYNDVINGMWDDPDSHKDPIFAPGHTVDDGMNEFHFRDDI